MTTVELLAPETLRLAERNVPEPGPTEIRIAVSHVGICGTDLEFYRGRRNAGYPFVLGHECSGTVDAVGRDVAQWGIGTAVTVRPNFGCGTCSFCDEGRDNLCQEGRGLGVTIDGCLAEYIVAPARYVFAVPEGIDFEAAALIEPAAVAERAVRRAGDLHRRRVLVLGAGCIGLIALQIARLGGAEVYAADPSPSRRQWAESLGAAAVFDPSAQLPADERFDVVLETAGVAEAVPLAIAHAEPGGLIVLTGIPMDPSRIETRWLVWSELRLVGSFIYELGDFAGASDRIRDGTLRVRELVTGRFPIDEATSAFAAAAQRGGVKVLIRVSKEAS